jgi:hypothetical protein
MSGTYLSRRKNVESDYELNEKWAQIKETRKRKQSPSRDSATPQWLDVLVAGDPALTASTIRNFEITSKKNPANSEGGFPVSLNESPRSICSTLVSVKERPPREEAVLPSGKVKYRTLLPIAQ